MMTSNYVMVSIKLCLDVANDDYIFTAHGASPVIISVFGRLYMKKNDHPPGREDTRSGTKKRCSRHLFCVILVAVLLAVLKL